MAAIAALALGGCPRGDTEVVIDDPGDSHCLATAVPDPSADFCTESGRDGLPEGVTDDHDALRVRCGSPDLTISAVESGVLRIHPRAIGGPPVFRSGAVLPQPAPPALRHGVACR